MYRAILRGQCAANERTCWIIYVKLDLIDCLLHHASVDSDSVDLAEVAIHEILESKIFDNSLLGDKSRQEYERYLANASYYLWKRGKEVEAIGDTLYKQGQNSTTPDLLDQAYSMYDSAKKLFTTALKALPTEPASIDAFNIITQKCNRNVRIIFMPNNVFGFQLMNENGFASEYKTAPNHQTKLVYLKKNG